MWVMIGELYKPCLQSISISLSSPTFENSLWFSSSVFQHILSPRVERINVLCIISLDRDAKKLGETAYNVSIWTPSTLFCHQGLDSELLEHVPDRCFTPKYLTLSSLFLFFRTICRQLWHSTSETVLRRAEGTSESMSTPGLAADGRQCEPQTVPVPETRPLETCSVVGEG